MVRPIIDDFPFPFQLPMAQELLRVMAALYRTEREAVALVEQHGIDPLTITPGLSAVNLWHELLEKAAIQGVTRPIVQQVRKLFPNNPRAALLDALLADRAVPVSAAPLGDTPPAFDDGVSEPEALLFFDDLTIPTGRVPNLIETLTTLLARVPAVCLLRVTNALGEFFGTGFRVGPALVLTNEHVLFPGGKIATAVEQHVLV